MPWEGKHSTSSAAAKRFRRTILRRDPICRCTDCPHHPGPCSNPSTEADHRIPIAEGGPPGVGNGQGLCRPCHAHKTQLEAQRGAARKRQSRHRPVQQHPGLR